MSSLFDVLTVVWPGLVMVATLAFVVAEAWRRLALRRGVLDVPGHRSSHVVATPRGAGVGIAVAVVVALAMWGAEDVRGMAVLIGIAAVAIVGLVDDFRPLPVAWKFGGQAVAALPLAFAVPLPLDGLPFGVPIALEVAGAVALIVLFVNAWNFMDGIDGIATLAAIAVCASAMATSIGLDSGLALWLPLAVLAACLGFLPLNFPNARAFMGDCGSHVLGYAMAAIVLAAPRGETAAVVLVASSAFLIDVLGTLLLRALDGERLTSAHRRHLYQLVTRSGYSHRRVTMVYGAWMLVSGGGMAVAESAGVGAIGAGVLVGITAATWWGLSMHFMRVLKERGAW